MPSKEHERVLQHLIEVGTRFSSPAADAPPYLSMRVAMDMLFTAPALESAQVLPADLPAVRAEWIVERGCDHSCRMLLLHGGGYIAGGIRSHRNLAMWISRATGCAVLLIDYRLAPEHPFPAAVEDAIAAFRWMVANGPDGPTRARRTFVIGDSAGGGLALALLMQLRDRHDVQADAAVTFSAWTDISNSSPSMIANENAAIGALKSVADYFTLQYLRDAGDARHPLASPVFGDPAGLPPLLMQVSDAEIVRDDSLRFASRARAAGVEVHLEQWSGVVHVWQGFVPLLPEAAAAIEQAGSFVRAFCARERTQ